MQMIAACRPVAGPLSAQRRSAGPSARPLGLPLRPASPAAARRVSAAASKPADFDELLMMVAEKFEKQSNKPVVVGYLVGAVAAIFAAEWLIHLPLFNVLLGFPIQFLGLVATPYLALRYYVKKEADPLSDVEVVVGKITSELPGLGKK